MHIYISKYYDHNESSMKFNSKCPKRFTVAQLYNYYLSSQNNQ